MPLRKKMIFPLFSAILLFGACSTNTTRVSQPTAILGAFKDEIRMLEDSISGKEIITLEGIKFVQGKLHGKSVVVAYTGIGKVNAAMTTTLLIHNFHPRAILFTGIAGSINPEITPGDIVVGKRTVQHDLNYVYDDSIVSYRPTNPVTDTLDPVFYPADPTLLHLADSVCSLLTLKKVDLGDTVVQPKIWSGTIATGDSFVASQKLKDQLIARFSADAVEMEGAAVAQVCYQFSIPCLIIRSISDSANDDAHLDIEKFLNTAAENASTVALQILSVMK